MQFWKIKKQSEGATAKTEKKLVPIYIFFLKWSV